MFSNLSDIPDLRNYEKLLKIAELKYLEHFERIKRFVRSSYSYTPVTGELRSKTILSDLTEITGIVHDRELLDFWCLFYFPEFAIKDLDLKFDLNQRIGERITQLLELIADDMKGTTNVDLESVMYEISMIFGSDYDFSLETILKAAEILRKRNEILKEDFEKLPKRKPDDTEVNHYLHHFQYDYCYESILALPKVQRQLTFNFFAEKVKSQLQIGEMFMELWEKELEDLGVNVYRSTWANAKFENNERVPILIRCFNAFRENESIQEISLKEKVQLASNLFALHGLEFNMGDLEIDELNDYLESYVRVFRYRSIEKLPHESYIEVIQSIFSQTLLAERALFSDKTDIDVSEVPNINILQVFGDIKIGMEEQADLEFIGMPASGKSTLTRKFKEKTNAYAEDELMVEYKNLMRAGITKYLDILRLIPMSELSIPKLYEIIKKYPLPNEPELPLDDPETLELLSRVRNKNIDAKYRIFSQDELNQNAFFQAMMLDGRTAGLNSRSMVNLYNIQIQLDSLRESDRPTIAVIFLTDIKDIIKRREPGEIVNEKFLKILLKEFFKLIYELTKPSKDHAPIAVLILDCSRNSVEKNFQLIVSAIQTLLGKNAHDLMKEA